MRREYPEAPIVGVGAVILHENQLHEKQVLIIQRGQEPLKGEWSLPGGALQRLPQLERASGQRPFARFWKRPGSLSSRCRLSKSSIALFTMKRALCAST